VFAIDQRSLREEYAGKVFTIQDVEEVRNRKEDQK
jgi:hypothetical protein